MIRSALQMSRIEFCTVFGFNLRTVAEWERQNREPEMPARILLLLVRDHPELILKALSET